VFFAKLQDHVSLLYETTAFSNVTDSVHVAPNNTEFFEGNFISLCWPFECCYFDDEYIDGKFFMRCGVQFSRRCELGEFCFQ
jgi:hypothetical protein